MAPHRRPSAEPKPPRSTRAPTGGGLFDPPEIDEDGDTEAVREASLLLDVPEWVDPETGELACDEPHRLEDH